MISREQCLLNEYKKYDFLNEDGCKIKILVGYIKPSFLFKSAILTPIHLGRNVEKEDSKDGIMSDENIKWLHENCIGDDDFEGNISSVNRRVGFLTGTYWAWKNYEKLGNPEYFGSFGYRKLFPPSCLESIEKYDLVIPQKTNFEISLSEQFKNDHGNKLYNAMIDTFKKVFPTEFLEFTKYLNCKNGYFYEIYIMKKELFEEFCEWIFKYLFTILEKYPNLIETNAIISDKKNTVAEYLGMNNKIYFNKIYQKPEIELRDIAFVVERITGYFLYKTIQRKNINYKEVFVIQSEHKDSMEIAKELILQKMRDKVRKK